MTGERVQRRLAAILAADVAGYSRLMGADEVWTLRELTQRRATLDGLITSHRGRIANTAGDSVLAEFGSAVDAVQCSVEAQAALAEANAGISPDRHINFRIGIHVGDVMVKGGDLFGDGVNIAARLEGIAEPGGICVSDDAYRQVRGKVDTGFDDLGVQMLKNIAEPMRAWRVRLDGALTGLVKPLSEPPRPALALPEIPSIAVLPFQNMSGDPEQEYFADGMVEDIITALSRFKSLFVIARNSSFTYKGRAVDIKQVGRELGVRYVLEGSVRKAGNRVRVTGQLIDAGTGNHIWADRYDTEIEDIFDLQDRVAVSVIGAISPQLERAEIDRAQRKPTENLQAYDYYLRARSSFHRITREANLEASKLAQTARNIDPEFAAAHALGVLCFTQSKGFGWGIDTLQEMGETRRLARRAIELDREDPEVLARAGWGLVSVVGEFEEGAALISRAVSLNPNLLSARYYMIWVNIWLGEVDAAIEQCQFTLRLSPLDPHIYTSQAGMAFAHFLAGRYEDALSWGTTAIRQQPNLLIAQRILMAGHAMSGRLQEAQQACALAMQLDPNQRISNIKDRAPWRRSEDIKKLAKAFRLAGMPE